MPDPDAGRRILDMLAVALERDELVAQEEEKLLAAVRARREWLDGQEALTDEERRILGQQVEVWTETNPKRLAQLAQGAQLLSSIMANLGGEVGQKHQPEILRCVARRFEAMRLSAEVAAEIVTIIEAAR